MQTEFHVCRDNSRANDQQQNTFKSFHKGIIA
jgi:hypothetical protein